MCSFNPNSNIFVWRDLNEINKAGYLYKATIEPDSTDKSNREPNEISTGMFHINLSYIISLIA